MREMCFLISANQNSCSFLLKKLWDGDNVRSDEYPVITTSALGILIHTKGRIWGNHKLSTYENCGGRVGRQHKECIGHSFTEYKGGTEDNATFVPSKDRTTVNATCYYCRKPGCLM